MKSENERLRTLNEHLEKVLPMAKEVETVNKIIKNDGYFRPPSKEI